MYQGLDISNNNGVVDLAAYRARGFRVVGVKASEGKTFIDGYFAGNVAHASKLGFVVLPYHFARPDSEPGYAGGVAEAQYFLAALHPHLSNPAVGLPVLDYESVRDIPFAVGFVHEIKRQLGVNPIIYVSGSRVGELRDASSTLAACPFWVAAYPTLLAAYREGVHVVMHQYTDRLDGRYDGDHVFVAPSTLLRTRPTAMFLVVRSRGRVVASVRYGKGRVRAFLVGGFRRIVLRDKTVTVTREKKEIR